MKWRELRLIRVMMIWKRMKVIMMKRGMMGLSSKMNQVDIFFA